MSTVVQTNYRPQIRPAVAGMPADMTDAEIQSYVSETSGLGFGLAVSVGSLSPIGCVLGGAKFLGITVRDVTLPFSSVDPLYSGAPFTSADQYQQYANVGVMTRGRIWVVAGAKVNVGDPVYYSANGTLSGSGGTSAVANYLFTVNPVAGNTLVINGTTVTFVASGAVSPQVNIGPTLGDTIVALANMINASADVNLTKIVAEAYPPSPGGSGQGSGSNQLLLSDKTQGVAGNAYTLTAGTTPGVTASGGTFSGGAAAGTLIPSSWFVTPTLVGGDLATVSLAIQR